MITQKLNIVVKTKPNIEFGWGTSIFYNCEGLYCKREKVSEVRVKQTSERSLPLFGFLPKRIMQQLVQYWACIYTR